MTTPYDSTVELIGELAAYRATYQFLLKALGASLSGLGEPARSLLVEEVERQFATRRGEWLHPVPAELSAELQAAGNHAMQQTLKALAAEIGQRLKTEVEPKT